MGRIAQWVLAGAVLWFHAAAAAPLGEPDQITLPSGDTVAVVKPTLSTKEMDLRLEKAIQALPAAKRAKETPAPPDTVTAPPALTGYSLYPR